MNLTAARPSINKPLLSNRIKSGTVYGLIIILALIAFEIFNFSTTAFALQDILGNVRFAGILWSTFLALAFCGIDFAGIARLIAPENRRIDLKESWYLFGAWLIAATANAALTWWGVAVSISGHNLQSSTVVDTQTLLRIVPVFVAILVWVIRILIIASLSSALERLNLNKKTIPSSMAFRKEGYPSSAPHTAQSISRPLTMTRISNNASASCNSSSARLNHSKTYPKRF